MKWRGAGGEDFPRTLTTTNCCKCYKKHRASTATIVIFTTSSIFGVLLLPHLLLLPHIPLLTQHSELSCRRHRRRQIGIATTAELSLHMPNCRRRQRVRRLPWDDIADTSHALSGAKSQSLTAKSHSESEEFEEICEVSAACSLKSAPKTVLATAVFVVFAASCESIDIIWL